MTTYLRSDVTKIEGVHLHTKKPKDHYLVLDCPECEPSVRLQHGLWADRPGLVPLTPDEEREKDELDREVALANAATGRAIREENTARARTARQSRIS